MKRIWNEIKSVKAEDGGAVSIEGWANKAVVDDVGDLMDFSAVDMKRYEKNPILLYNHDRNLPIGKVVEAKVEKDGLWVKALISNSKDVVVSYVRDLVKEGILKTFSIGFEPKKEDRKDGVNVIKEWRLNEISIVTLPANIEAEFALAKSLGEAKSLDEARALVLKAMEPPPPPTPPEGEEDKPENKEPTDEAKNAFQECVSAKIPKLIEEGRDQEQAVAVAMSMCREEGKCAVELMTPEMFAYAKEVAAGCKKPDTGKALPGEEATPVSQPSDDPSNFGSPHLDLMKSQLALLGKISEQLGALAAMLAKDSENEENEDTETVAPPPPPPPAEPEKDQEVEQIKQRINAIVKDLGI